MSVEILIGDALTQLRTLPDESVHACITSPPYYGLRCYGTEGQIGLEDTPEAHIARLVEVFQEVRRVLRVDGVCWVNYGDCYATQPAGNKGITTSERWSPPKADNLTYGGNKPFSTIGHGAKPKDLLMLPARVALALQADGWWIRSQIPWLKRSAMPESANDRPATAIEYVFLLTKSARYFWDGEAVRQRSDWGGQTKKPDGWATHAGGHGSFHKDGREKGERSEFNGGGRNFRNSDLFYDSLRPPYGLICGPDGEPLALDVNPAGFAEAHFATFPPKLVEPLIKAATSEKGCCPACGAPWVREVETTYTDGGPKHTGNAKALRYGRNDHAVAEPYKTRHGKTLGWSPSCECKHVHGFPYYDDDIPAPVPCTVLDPFGGAGTTGLVADRLGRNAVLIELNAEYAAMTRKRIDTDAATRGRGPAPVMRGDDLPLFAEDAT